MDLATASLDYAVIDNPRCCLSFSATAASQPMAPPVARHLLLPRGTSGSDQSASQDLGLGIGIGCALLAVLMVVLTYCWCCRISSRQRRRGYYRHNRGHHRHRHHLHGHHAGSDSAATGELRCAVVADGAMVCVYCRGTGCGRCCCRHHRHRHARSGCGGCMECFRRSCRRQGVCILPVPIPMPAAGNGGPIPVVPGLPGAPPAVHIGPGAGWVFIGEGSRDVESGCRSRGGRSCGRCRRARWRRRADRERTYSAEAAERRGSDRASSVMVAVE